MIRNLLLFFSCLSKLPTYGLLFLFALFSEDARSQISAMVEDASPNLPYQQFDFIERHTEIQLGKDGFLTIGYLNSCILEKITGGRVIVDAFQSFIFGGAVVREKVSCVGNGLTLNLEESAQSGADVFRGKQKGGYLHKIVLGGPPIFIGQEIIGEITIENELTGAQLDIFHDHRILDLKKIRASVPNGSMYRVTYKGVTFEVHVDLLEAGQFTSFISRLIRLP